jgi:hypothetical protein
MARAFVAASSQYLERSAAVVSGMPCTLAAWIRPNSTAVSRYPMSVSNNGSPNGWLMLDLLAPSLTISADAFDGTNNPQAVSAVSLTAGVWGHVAGVFASTTSRTVYVNGGNAVSNSGSMSAPTLNTTTIGSGYFNAAHLAFFDGDIAEAAIWNVALDAAEIAALGAGVSPFLIRPTALVAYWPIMGTTSPEIDPRGRNELTVVGATATAHPRIYTPIGTYQKQAIIPHFITGVTKDTAGAAIASATVRLFRASDDALIATTTSDGSGNYSFTVADTSTLYWLEAYKSGSPDIAGTTVRTLVGV